MEASKRGLRKETRGLSRHLRTKEGMPLLPTALKGCKFLITPEIFSSEIDMGGGISTGYEALGMSERSASGNGGKNHAFRASASSVGVVAFPEGLTRLGMEGGVGGRWLLFIAHFARSHMPFLFLAVSATACLKCAALAFLIASALAWSAPR